ncbi:MAG TPA: 50S ribosomal protein L31 [Fimbriimonadales bacterium]|nr:50S ribosomal protein L31 [Fimbriimonadales bacterium]
MKQGIHPKYVECKVYCACTPDRPITTIMSTKPELRVDICSNCHPLYTGQQKLVDSAGRVEKFLRRYGKTQQGGKK